MVITLTAKHGIAALAATGLLVVGGFGAWRYMQPQLTTMSDPSNAPVDTHAYKYVGLEKVVVMLRGNAGEPMAHYLAVDLVFKTPAESEKVAKEHLPLLRSVAVKALSEYTLEKASMMSIDQFTAAINRAYSEAYAREQQEKPFTGVMIGKLIIE